MISKRATWAGPLAIVCAALLIGACSKSDDGTGPTGPQPGQLKVTVSTTGSAGAAYLLTVRGAGITNPAPANGSHRLYSYLAADTLRVALVGTVSSGDLLTFGVPDVNAVSSYRVTLNEVAGTDNELLSASAFDLEVSR